MYAFVETPTPSLYASVRFLATYPPLPQCVRTLWMLPIMDYPNHFPKHYINGHSVALYRCLKTWLSLHKN